MGFLKAEKRSMGLGWRILLFMVLFSVFGVLGGLIPIPGLLGRTLPVLVAALLAGWYLLALEGRGPGALGFYPSRAALGELGKGVALGVVVGTVALLGMVAGGGVWWTVQPGTVGEYLRVAVASLWLFAVPAAAEEALLRGYPLQALAAERGPAFALWVTSGLFAMLHLGNPGLDAMGLGNLVVAGLFLGVVYLKTASLWWATGAHLGWNWSVGFLGDLPVSGLELVDAPLLEPRIHGPEWVSGGAFGPEASIMATATLALAAFLLWRSPVLRPSSAALEKRPLFLPASEANPEPERGRGTFTSDDSGRKS